MKKILCVFSILIFISTVSAMDISILGQFGNNGMSWNSATPIADSTFPYNNWIPGCNISITENTPDGISFSINYILDPILRSLLTGTINYNLGIFKLGIGPMAGLFNSWSAPVKAGITSMFGIDVLGIFFAGISVGSSIGAPPVSTGDYTQEYNTLYAGYYLSNAVCTFSLETKNLYLNTAPDSHIVDRSTEYKFITELFKKNMPYTITIGFSALKLTRDYGNNVLDSLFNLIVKTKFSFSLIPGVYIDGLFDAVVYSLGLDALTGRGPASNTLLFTAGIGVTIRPGLFRTSPGQTSVEQVPSSEAQQATDMETQQSTTSSTEAQ